MSDLVLFGEPPSPPRRLPIGMYSALRGNWRTPQQLYAAYVPPCFDVTDRHGGTFSGLHDEWPEPWWANPPYGRGIERWTARMGGHGVALLPVRTDTAWFHDHILGRCRIEFIRRRLQFDDAMRPAPFPSMLCHFGQPESAIDTVAAMLTKKHDIYPRWARQIAADALAAANPETHQPR